MEPATVLTGSWRGAFEAVVGSAEARLTLCAPFISDAGVRAVHSARGTRAPDRLSVLILTDLSAEAVCAGATDPAAIASLASLFPRSRTVHLPRLHAKAYAADGRRAIVTSGNLTAGGLSSNHECGVLLEDAPLAGAVERGVAAYADLGGLIDAPTLARVCDMAEEARAAYKARLASASRESKRRISAALRSAGDALLRARLAEGPIHTVFARTIRFLLDRYGPLTTEQLHPLIQGLHPDLCDDAVDRVIGGKRFGKRWKHAVRTAQQQLKKQGVVALRGEVWVLAPS